MADNNSVVYLSAPKIDASNYDDVVRKIDSLVLSADNAASAMQTLRDMAKSKIEIGLDPKDSNKQMKDLAEIAVLMKAIWKINPLEQIEFKSEKATIQTLGDIEKVMDEFARHMASKSNELEGTMQKFDGTFQDFQKTQRSGIAKDVKKEFEDFADVFKSSGKKIEKNSKEMTEIVEKAIAVQYSSSQRLNETGTRRFISQGDGFKTSDTVKNMIANSGISNAQEIVQAYEDQLKSKSDEMMRAIQSVDSKYYNEILNSVGINFTKGGKGGKGGQSANSNFKFSGLGEQYRQWAADYLDVTGEITKAEKQMNEATDLINKKINGDKSVEYLNATDLEKYYVQSYQQLQRVYEVIGKEMPEKITKDGSNLINRSYNTILKNIQSSQLGVEKILDAQTGGISFKQRKISSSGDIQEYIYEALDSLGVGDGVTIESIISNANIDIKDYKKAQQDLIKLKEEANKLYSILDDVEQTEAEKNEAKNSLSELIKQAQNNKLFNSNKSKDYAKMESKDFNNAIDKEMDFYQNYINDVINGLKEISPQIRSIMDKVFAEFIQYGSTDEFTKLFNSWNIAFDEDGEALNPKEFVKQINDWVTQISQAYKSAGIDMTSLNEELQDPVSQLYLMFGDAGVLKGVINTKPIAGDISVQTQTIENLRQRIHELEASVQSMKEQGQVDTSKSTQEIKALTDEISNLKIELEQAKQQASQSFEMQEQIEKLKSEIEGYNIQLAQAREYMEKFKEANSELSEADKKKITELEAAISARDQKIAELEKKQLEIEKAVNQTEYDALNKLLIEKNTLITQLTEQTLELQTKLSQISDKIGNSDNGQVDELINQLTNYQSQYQELFDNHIDDKQENAEVKKIQRCQQMNDILNSIADTYERINKYELSDEQKSKISSLKVVDKKHDNKEYDLQDKQQRDIQSGYNSRSISKYNNLSVVKGNSIQSDKASGIGKELIELYNQLKTADFQKMSSQELQILKARQDLQREQAQEWLFAYEKRQDADKTVIDQMYTVTTLLFEKSEEIQTILNEAAKPKKASGSKAKPQSTKKTQPKAATQQVAEGLEELFEGGKTSETTNGNKQNGGGQAKNEDEKEHGGIEIDSGTITKIEEVIKKNTTAIDKNTAALNEIIESKKPIDNPQLYEVLKRFIKSENIGDKQSVSQLTAYLQKHQSDLSVIGLGTPDKSGKSTTTRLVELLSAFEEKDKLIKTNGETIDFKNFNKKSLQLQKPLTTDDTLINHISETLDNIKNVIDKKLKSPDKKQDSEDDNDVKKILTEINQKISTEKNVEIDSDKISKAIVDSMPKVNIDTAQLNDTINKALSDYNATQKSINETFGKILTEIQTIKNNVPQGDSQNNNSQTVTNGLSKVIYELSQKLSYQLQARAHMVESGFVANTEHNTASLDVTDDFGGTSAALSDLLKDVFKEIYHYAQDLSQHSHPSKIATPSPEDFSVTINDVKHGKNNKGMAVAIDEIFEWTIGNNTLENINKWNQFIAEYTQKTNELKSSIDYSEVFKDITGQVMSDIINSTEFHNAYVDAANIFKDIGFKTVNLPGSTVSVSKDIERYQEIAPNMLNMQNQFVDKLIELQKNKGNKFKDSDEEDATRKRLATAFNHRIDYTTNKLKFKSNSMYDAQFSMHEFFQSELQKILIDTLKSNGLENSYRIKSVSDYLSENPITSINTANTNDNGESDDKFLYQFVTKLYETITNVNSFPDKLNYYINQGVKTITNAIGKSTGVIIGLLKKIQPNTFDYYSKLVNNNMQSNEGNASEIVSEFDKTIQNFVTKIEQITKNIDTDNTTVVDEISQRISEWSSLYDIYIKSGNSDALKEYGFVADSNSRKQSTAMVSDAQHSFRTSFYDELKKILENNKGVAADTDQHLHPERIQTPSTKDLSNSLKKTTTKHMVVQRDEVFEYDTADAKKNTEVYNKWTNQIAQFDKDVSEINRRRQYVSDYNKNIQQNGFTYNTITKQLQNDYIKYIDFAWKDPNQMIKRKGEQWNSEKNFIESFTEAIQASQEYNNLDDLQNRFADTMFKKSSEDNKNATPPSEEIVEKIKLYYKQLINRAILKVVQNDNSLDIVKRGYDDSYQSAKQERLIQRLNENGLQQYYKIQSIPQYLKEHPVETTNNPSGTNIELTSKSVDNIVYELQNALNDKTIYINNIDFADTDVDMFATTLVNSIQNAVNTNENRINIPIDLSINNSQDILNNLNISNEQIDGLILSIKEKLGGNPIEISSFAISNVENITKTIHDAIQNGLNTLGFTIDASKIAIQNQIKLSNIAISDTLVEEIQSTLNEGFINLKIEDDFVEKINQVTSDITKVPEAISPVMESMGKIATEIKRAMILTKEIIGDKSIDEVLKQAKSVQNKNKKEQKTADEQGEKKRTFKVRRNRNEQQLLRMQDVQVDTENLDSIIEYFDQAENDLRTRKTKVSDKNSDLSKEISNKLQSVQDYRETIFGLKANNTPLTDEDRAMINRFFDEVKQLETTLIPQQDDVIAEATKSDSEKNSVRILLNRVSDIKNRIQLIPKEADNLTKVSEYENNLKNIKNVLDNTQLSSTDREEIDKQIKELRNEINQLNLDTLNSKRESTQEANKYKYEAQYEELIGSVRRYRKTNSRIANSAKLTQQFDALEEGINTDEKSLENLMKYRQEFAKLQKDTDTKGLRGRTFFDSVSNVMQRIGLNSFVGGGITRIVSYLRQMVTSVKELDKEMTVLRRVTNETTQTYDSFLSDAIGKASKLGVTITDLVGATSEFSKLGYSINEAQSLGEAAAIYSKVGFLDMSTAIQSMTSVIQGFKLSAEDAMSVVDKMNQVGNSYAISSAGIGSALQRSASSLVAAGNDIDESIALITAGNTVLADPESVANGIKVIGMRIRGAKSELENSGEETEDLVTSTSKLQEKVKAISGVDIMLDENNFKSTYEIIKEISAVWGDLSDIDQASLLELLAGKNRSNILAAILQSPDVLENQYKTSQNSEGSAQRELEKYLDSIEGKTYQIKSQTQQIAEDVIDKEWIKSVLDMANVLLKAFDKVMTFDENAFISILEKINELLDKGSKFSSFFTGFTKYEKSLSKINSIVGLISALSVISGKQNKFFSPFVFDENFKLSDLRAEGLTAPENDEKLKRTFKGKAIERRLGANMNSDDIPEIREQLNSDLTENVEQTEENVSETMQNLENATEEITEQTQETANENDTPNISEIIGNAANDTVESLTESVTQTEEPRELNDLEQRMKDFRDEVLEKFGYDVLDENGKFKKDAQSDIIVSARQKNGTSIGTSDYVAEQQILQGETENEDFSILLTANTDNLPEPVVEQLQGEISSEDDGVVVPATVEIKTEEDSEEEIQEEIEDLFEDEQPEITASARVTEVDVGEQEVTNTENIDTSVQTQELSADIVNQANKLRELTNINVIDENGAIRSIDAIQAEYDEFSNRIQEEGDADRISELISNGEEIQSLMNQILGGGEDSAEDETGQDRIEQANESTQNLIESLGNASEQTRENSEQNEENAESTEEQSVATDNLVGMYQILKAKYAQWKQQNPDGTMSQFAAQTAGAQAKTMALTAAQAALNAAWSMGLSFLITTVTSAITAAIKYYDNLAEQGVELAKQFKDDSDSLSEFTDKIKKYKEELNSGNLTENEQYDVRTKLLDIQSEMIDKYGLEQSGIDLVNGSLSDQINIIERLNKQQANNYLTENKSQIEEAEKFMSTGLNGFQRFVGQHQARNPYYEKQMEIKTSDLSKLQKNDEKQYERISQLAQKNGLTISGDLLLTDGLEYYEKEDALKNFAQDIRNSQIIDTNDVDNLLKFIEKRIDSMQTDSYKNNKDIMANAQISMIMTDSEYSEIYNDITEQTNAYNEQVAKGDASSQTKYFEELEQLYKDSTDENNVGNVWVRRYFEDMFDGVISSMRRREYQNEMKDTRGKTYTSAKEVIDMYFEVADDQTIKNAVEGTEEYIALMNLVDESPVDSIEELVDSWVELGLVTSKTLKESSSQVSSYSSIVEGLSDSLSKRDKLSSAISSMLNGETLDMSTLSELLETYPDLIDDMTFANGKYTVSLEGLKKAQNAVMQQAGLNLGEKISDSRKQIDDLYSKIDVWEKAIARDEKTKSDIGTLQTKYNNIQRQKQSTEDKIQSNNDIIVSNMDLLVRNEEYISLTKNQERYSRVQDNIYEKTGEYTKQAKYRYDAAMSTISAEKNINEETKKAIKSNEKLVGLRKIQDAVENNVLTDIAQQGYTLNENGEIVTKTGQTYHDLSNQTRIYNSNIDEARKSIEAHEKEIKQLKFAWQYAMYQAKDYAGQVNSILSGSTSANDLIQQMTSEQEQYGSVSADTQASFMEIVPNWAEYLDTTEDGIIKLVEDKTNDIVDGVTNYTEKIEFAQKELDEARRRQAVNASSEQVLGYMMNKYSDGSILYDTNKSYDENLAQFREWVNKTPEVYKQIGQAGQWLSNLERERMDSSIQIDTAQDAYNILKQAGEASDNQAKISDFTQQIQVLEKQLDREEITSTQFADAFEELFEKIFGELFDDTGALMGKGFSSTQIATLEEWWKKNRDQLKQKAENEYSTAISDAERQFQLGNITAQELQSKKSALNEQYYGQNGILGQTDEGKRAYQENAEQVADMNKDIFDELNEEGQRLKTYQDQSAKEYWTHYLEYAETYLKGMPKEYKAAMDEYHTTGVKEMYDEDLQILENNLALGLITTAQYWSQREQLYKQYLANEPALHEDAIQEEITLRTEAITQQFEREQTLLERNYENGAITAAEYLDEYKKLWEQYYKDKKELAEEDYETQKNLLDATKNALSEQIDSLEDYNEELVAPYQSEIDALNETKDKYDDVINTKVKGLEKQKKAIEKANEQQEKENNLLEKKNALEKASIQNRLVYTGSGNWEARRDDEAYESALKEYNDAAETKLTDQIDKQIEALQEAQENVDDSIEKEIKSREETMSELKQPVETLIDVLNEILNENKGIDPEFIKNMLGTEKGQQAWDKIMSAARTNDRIANKYGQSLYKQEMSEGEVYSLLNDIAKEYGMSTYEFANSLGLDLPALQKQSDAQVTAVSDEAQAVIDNTTSQDANTQALNDLTTTLGGTVTATEENTKASNSEKSSYEEMMQAKYEAKLKENTKASNSEKSSYEEMMQAKYEAKLKENTKAVKDNTKSTDKQTAAEKKAEQATKQAADQAQAQTYFSTKELEQIYAGTYNISSGSKIFKANGMPQLVKQINGNAQLAQYEANKAQMASLTGISNGSQNQYVSMKDIDVDSISNPDIKILTKTIGVANSNLETLTSKTTTSNANDVKPNVFNNTPVITTNITVEGSADQKTIDAIGEKVESTITTMLNKATQSITSGYQKQMYTNK